MKRGAARATGVDLDEHAIEQARENAKLNRVGAEFVYADAFGYMRDMFANRRQFELVVLDPPKLIRNRALRDEGETTYRDMNRLALELVAPGGLLLTCSCSGLLDATRFLQIVLEASRTARVHDGSRGAITTGGRTIQLLARSGAAADHPVWADCPETEYLHAFWIRVL
jgi:23S rRNA (cytosine1962-C5)-methyltransferase